MPSNLLLEPSLGMSRASLRSISLHARTTLQKYDLWSFAGCLDPYMYMLKQRSIPEPVKSAQNTKVVASRWCQRLLRQRDIGRGGGAGDFALAQQLADTRKTEADEESTKGAERVARTGVITMEGFQEFTRQEGCFPGCKEGQTQARGEGETGASVLRISLQTERSVGDERTRIHAGFRGIIESSNQHSSGKMADTGQSLH